MPREIKTTLSLDGEQAFKRAINEANTSMKNLGTQLTLAAAKFKQDGDAMKLMETRSKALNAEIRQQDEIVKALEKAVQDSTKAWGENSAKTEKWQAELNRAKAKLVNLQNELTLNEAGLDRNGKAFEDSSEKVAEYQATLASVGKGINLDSLKSGIGGVTSVVEGAISKVIELGKKIVEVMKEAAGWADDLITESIRNQMSTEEYQRMEYASKFADTSVDQIMTARDKVIQKMAKGWKNGDIDMWEFLGIDANTARDPMDVLFEFGRTLQNVAKDDGNIVRANEWAMEVLGRRYKDLLPLFTYGQDEFYARMAEAPVVKDEDVQKLGNLNDKFDELEHRLSVLKETALAQLAPALSGIIDSINAMLENFSAWLETDEGKKAMEDLGSAITELFSGLTNVDFSSAIETVKTAITSIKDVLLWLIEKKDSIFTALEVIGAGFALLKVSETVLKFLSLKNGLSNLLGGNGNNTPSTQPTAPSAEPTEQPTTQPTGTGGGKGSFWTRASDGIRGLFGAGSAWSMMGGAATIAPIAALIAGGYAGARMIGANLSDEALNQVYGGENGEGDVFDTMDPHQRELAWRYFKVWEDKEKTGSDEAMAAREELLEALEEGGYELAEQSVSLIENAFENWEKENTENGLAEKVDQLLTDMEGKEAEQEEQAATETELLARSADVFRGLLSGTAAKTLFGGRKSEINEQAGFYINDELYDFWKTFKTITDLAGSTAEEAEQAQKFAQQWLDFMNDEDEPDDGPMMRLWEMLDRNGLLEEFTQSMIDVAEGVHQYGDLSEFTDPINTVADLIEQDMAERNSETKVTPDDLADLSGKEEMSTIGNRLAEAMASVVQNTDSGVKAGDIKALNNLPALIQAAAQSGTAAGASGIRVYLDGYVVGQLVTPYVSQAIAHNI